MKKVCQTGPLPLDNECAYLHSFIWAVKEVLNDLISSCKQKHHVNCIVGNIYQRSLHWSVLSGNMYPVSKCNIKCINVHLKNVNVPRLRPLVHGKQMIRLYSPPIGVCISALPNGQICIRKLPLINISKIDRVCVSPANNWLLSSIHLTLWSISPHDLDVACPPDVSNSFFLALPNSQKSEICIVNIYKMILLC